MITINEIENKVNIKFGENGMCGVILSNHQNSLLIQDTPRTDVRIGDSVKAEDIKPLPKIDMEFSDIESIDVLIKQLERIKTHIQYPHGTLALAC